MGTERRGKIGLSHWPFDCDFFDDIRIRKLVKYQGGKAPLVYIYLLSRIYKERGYYLEWDKELPFVVADCLGTGYDEGYVFEVIKACISIGLFDERLFSQGVLSSRSIQLRYSEICASLRRKCVIDKYDAISEDEPLIVEDNGLTATIKGEIVEDKHTIEKNRIEENKKEISPNGDTKKDSDAVDEKKDLETRKHEFGKSLIPYMDKYGKEMIRDFFDYWTEVNDGGRKMAFEIAKGKKGTFCIANRLATWKKNEPIFKSRKQRERGVSITDAVKTNVIMPDCGDASFDIQKLLK